MCFQETDNDNNKDSREHAQMFLRNRQIMTIKKGDKRKLSTYLASVSARVSQFLFTVVC